MSRLVRTALWGSALWLCSFGLLACSDPAELGGACIDSADCVDGLRCFLVGRDPNGDSACMSTCDMETTRRCDDGSACIGASDSEMMPLSDDVCYLGGETALEAECEGTLDCTRGAMCIQTMDAPPGEVACAPGSGRCFCYQVCVLGDTAGCPTGTTCQPLAGEGTNGFCQPDP